jgi:DNA-binding beta-propeller fold protein YncE
VTDAAIAHLGSATLPVSMARDANGTLVVLGRRAADGSRYTVEVWDVTRAEKRAEFTVEHEPQVVALSPSGNIVAAGEGYGTTSVWSLADSSRHWTAKSRYGTEALAFTSDGAHLALAGAGGDSVFVWDSRTGRIIKQLHHAEMSHSLAFSPRDDHLVTGGLFGKLRCFRPHTYEEYPCPYKTENGYAASLTFSREGTYLAVGGPTPRIIDANGRVVLRFPDRAGRVDFTSDGRYAVVAPSSPFGEVMDYRTRVWDVARATEVVGIDHEWPVGDAIFVAGDRYIATIADLGPLPEATEVARAGQAFIWPWRWADLLTQATSRVARNLTRAEWERFIGPKATYRPARTDLPVVDK